MIDLSKHGGPVFIGRDKGELVREEYNLEEIDTSDRQVVVKIPKDTFSINSSFFLGLFGKSIRSAGTKEKFLQKFAFIDGEQFTKTINDSISRALFEKTPLV